MVQTTDKKKLPGRSRKHFKKATYGSDSELRHVLITMPRAWGKYINKE